MEFQAIQIRPSMERGPGSFSLIYFLISIVFAGAAFYIDLFWISMLLSIISGWFLWTALINFLHRSTGKFNQIYSIANELNAISSVLFLLPLTFFKSYHKARGNLKGRPILMLNGYLGFASELHYHRRNLIKNGFGPIYTMNVRTGRAIESNADDVDKKVEEIRKETGRDDLILIGHSKGGLVCVYYALHQAQEHHERITDVITIGSPLTGAPLARFSPGRDAHEMRPGDPFTQEMRREIFKNSSIRFFHIGSLTDEIVPAASALIGSNPSRQLLLKDTGHFSLLFSSRISDQIAKWLKE